jgi:hypothetical protein
MLYHMSVLPGCFHVRFYLANCSGVKVIRTNHRGGAASGRHDPLDIQSLISAVPDFKNVACQVTFNDFAEIVLHFLYDDSGPF